MDNVKTELVVQIAREVFSESYLSGLAPYFEVHYPGFSPRLSLISVGYEGAVVRMVGEFAPQRVYYLFDIHIPERVFLNKIEGKGVDLLLPGQINHRKIDLIFYEYLRYLCASYLTPPGMNQHIEQWAAAANSGIRLVNYDKIRYLPETDSLERSPGEIYVSKDRLALTRSRILLDSFLTIQQQASLLATNSFRVRGPLSGFEYELKYGVSGNITAHFSKQGDDRVWQQRLCIVPDDAEIPTYDHLLAQLLIIQTDESYFMRTAQTTSLGPSSYTWHEAVKSVLGVDYYY